jgi:hypothetical protein
MKGPTYSSLTAFLAHRRALRSVTTPTGGQSATLAAMEALIAELVPGEREALEAADTAGDGARHRQRAERNMTRILRERGVLAG